jgi:hypothetical protein
MNKHVTIEELLVVVVCMRSVLGLYDKATSQVDSQSPS